MGKQWMGQRTCTASCSIVVVALWLSAPATALVRTVDDDGAQCPGAFATDIQTALDVSSPGDVVLVCSGVYAENVTVPDGVSLESTGDLLSTYIRGEDTATVGAAVVTMGSDTSLVGFDIACPTCTNGTIAGVANAGPAESIYIANNIIHTLRDNEMDISVGGFDMSGVRLFGVENIVVTGNWIYNIDNRLDPSTFTSRARGIFVSGGDANDYRAKSEGFFIITDNFIDTIVGFRPIGINVHRMDQDVGFADLLVTGNCVSTLFDTGFILGGVAYEMDEIEELDDGGDGGFNHAERVNIGFAIRNSTNLNFSVNRVSQLSPIGNTINLALDAPDVPGTGHDNVFCDNTLDAAGAILVGPNVVDNTFPFGRTYVFPFGQADSPALGGDGAVEAANEECTGTTFVCPTDPEAANLVCARPDGSGVPPQFPQAAPQAGPNLVQMFDSSGE